MCYTYDNLSRVTARTVKKLSDNSVVSTETFNYDAAGNVTSAPDSSFQYDTNNRLISFNGNTVSYDLDGNMLSNGSLTCTYDSANRLVSAGGHTYTYNAEDVRIRNLCSDEDTTYTYNTNAKLSMLLMKTTNGVVTKYVYGRGLIGEETSGAFKTYHFDCRGSTIAITDASGNITDTFAYDTYGKLISRTGTSAVIFGYNGRDGVVTDDNGLIYMRARYYSPAMKRFINADVIDGAISNAITLNRFAYANGNPVSFVDPFGLTAERCLNAINDATKNFFAKISSYIQTLLENARTNALLEPSVLEAAYMAEHIYGAQSSDIGKSLAEKFGGWVLADILTNSESLKIGIYTKTVNGIVSYAFVNKGSSMEWSDWKNNFQQPFGWSTDMEDSIKYAKDFVEDHSDAKTTFIGHSKGGAEAAANAVATNKDAILFNPATVFLDSYGLNAKTYSANMTAYIVKGEILNDIFGLISAPIDKMEYLPTQYTSKWYDVVGQVDDSIKNHQMEAVISALGGE